MRIDWAIPCRYAEVQPAGGATIVGAGTDVVVAAQVPLPAQLLFAVRLVGSPEEADHDIAHPIACRIYDVQGELAGEQVGEIRVGVEQLVPGFLVEIIIPMGVVLEATAFGSYGVEFEIDEHRHRVPIHVVERPAPEE